MYEYYAKTLENLSLEDFFECNKHISFLKSLYIFLEEARQYKTIGNNIIQFDKGPRIIRHPPAYTSLGGDLGLNVSWRCDAVAKGNVSYQWLKNNQVHAMDQRIDKKV